MTPQAAADLLQTAKDALAYFDGYAAGIVMFGSFDEEYAAEDAAERAAQPPAAKTGDAS